ncbi:sensor histidine kinase [Thalassotalea hakodatensis]|uniref:sensor histidine kinase n=1 Tax=Thalassotalea hakodatensis TaxID=3030492 RepID=UPI0025745D6F|nr:HAMP domain-containing sensor histidine kinase [Thalassotalea hakodatensis]
MDNTQRSLPSAITYLVVGLALTYTVIYSLLILTYSWIVEDNIFNRLVASEANYIEQQFLLTNKVSPPRAGFITLHKNWHDVPVKIAKGYVINPKQVEYSLDDGRSVHVQVFELGGNVYTLLADVAGFEVSRDYLPNIIVWLVAFATFLAFIVSMVAYLIAKRITNPIKILANDVSKFSVNYIPKDFAHSYPDNELRILATKIEQSFSQLQAALKREVNFTRDVSHEIRTPISIVKNVLSNYQKSLTLSSEEFEQIYQANFELEKITHTLLALARNESSETTSVNLTELIENIVLQHFELNHSEKGKALKLKLQLEENVFQTVNKNLVQILLNNILSNIVQYATATHVAILLSSVGMSFRNQTADLVPNQPQRSGTKSFSSTGIGQGLNLIERICETNGWKMRADYQQGMFELKIYFNPQVTPVVTA